MRSMSEAISLRVVSRLSICGYERQKFKVQCSVPVLNEVKDLARLERSFEAQDARSAHLEPGNFEHRFACAPPSSCVDGHCIVVFPRSMKNPGLERWHSHRGCCIFDGNRKPNAHEETLVCRVQNTGDDANDFA